MITLTSVNAESEIYINNQNNTQIQEILDNAEDNTTLIFTNTEYNNLNLIINHSIKLQSNNSKINSNTQEPVFKITNTNNIYIKGFTINSIGDGVYAENSNNIILTDNTITSQNNGIILNGVTNAQIINNTLIKNNNSALLIQRSNRIQISNNTITETVNDGIILKGSTSNVNITNNKLTSNGLYSKYAINLIQTTSTDKQNNIFIAYNNISDNGNGINVNVSTNKLNITENAIIRGAKGVNLDQGFRKSDTALYIDYNVFIQGSDLCIDARGSIYETVGGIVVGYNWFNRNSNNGFICPRVQAGILQSNIRQIGENTYEAYFTQDGEEISTLANFNLRVKVNGKIGYSSIANGVGTFTIPGEVDSENNVVIGADEEIKVKINQYTKPTKQDNNPTNNSGSSSENQGQNSISESNTNSKSTSSSTSTSGSVGSTSSSNPTSSQDSTSQVVKTLTYDEDSFRVIGIPGLLLLIIFAILIYYNEDIRKALKK